MVASVKFLLKMHNKFSHTIASPTITGVPAVTSPPSGATVPFTALGPRMNRALSELPAI
jgi:hypothetical protein